MKKRLLSLFLAFVTLLGILPTAALAANTEEEALGEVDIYNGGYELSYLTINGRIRTQDYTYFNYVDAKGQKKEVPAYCVNPNIKGVPQTVGVGESIKYLANERSSDPKVVGIISNGYPHRSLGELKLDNKYQAYYATKMALWCYLLPNWNIANLKVAPGLTGSELDIGNRILAAAKDIYKRGTTYNYMLEPRMTATPDKSAAYSVTVDGKQYKQQVFTIWSETWVYDYDIAVSFADPGSVPQGTRIVDENDQDITAVTTKWTGDGYGGKFKVLYPADSIEGESGSVQLSLTADVAQYLDRTSSGTGEICWEGLEPGVYSLIETSTVSDHLLDPTEYHVQLFPGKDATICLQNDKRPNLTIWKFDADDHSIPIPNTTFLLEAADGHSVAEVTTGPDGSVTVPNLWPGVFKISERSVGNDAYLVDAPDQYITLYPNRDREAYFYDHKRPVIEIIKENSITHDRLPNVRFQVWYASNDTETGELNDLGVFTTDENGRIELTGPANGLRDGWFRVKELAPPTGFSIKDSDTQEAFIPAGKGHTFLFENTPLSALVVYKQDSVTGAGISGCRFQLKYLGGEVSGSGGTVIGNYVSSANGSFTATGLKKGYYICEELESDGAHVIDSAPQSFYISGEDQDIVTLYFSNAPKGAVLVKKVSDDDKKLPLSGVEFFVTTSDGAVVGDNNGKFVTDSAGSFLVENVAPGTSLVVKETRAKPGYLLDDVPQTVQVKAGQTVTLEFRNKPLGNLVIEKWGRNGTKTVPLEGVKFEIKYADGRYVDDGGGTLSSKGIYYSDSTGKITLSGVTGTVIATELESVSGYTIDPDSQSQTVTINPNDTQTLRFYNNAVGGVEIIKVSSADKTKRIPNTTFEIRRVSDDALVDTVTTGKTGSVFVTLEDDSYYAVETESAEGFKLDNTPHYFTVKDGSCPPLTVTNAPLSGILLHKISTADGKGIPGVSFILYDSGHNPIDQQTTDDRGYAWFEDLTVSGRYYLRELENEGYIPDTQERTVYVKAGETTKVTWKNTPITGQIQIVKKSADYNPTTGLPAGTLLEGAVFEITDKAGNVVDTIRSDSRGLAVSKPLPLSRYTIREVKAPSNYGVNEQELTAYTLSNHQRDHPYRCPIPPFPV